MSKVPPETVRYSLKSFTLQCLINTHTHTHNEWQCNKNLFPSLHCHEHRKLKRNGPPNSVWSCCQKGQHCRIFAAEHQLWCTQSCECQKETAFYSTQTSCDTPVCLYCTKKVTKWERLHCVCIAHALCRRFGTIPKLQTPHILCAREMPYYEHDGQIVKD